MAHPLSLVLIAHTLFSIGIWQARDGYWEETDSVRWGLYALENHQANPSAYVNLMALGLRWVSSDPLVVATLLRYLSSLLATVALFLTLSSFSRFLRTSAIVFACFVWIASSLHAPFVQSTSQSLFAFGAMLFGTGCLLRRESVTSTAAFYACGLVAARTRPEYYAPILLTTVLLLVTVVWRAAGRIEARFGLSRWWLSGIAASAAVVGANWLLIHPPAALRQRARDLDAYALVGLGQCYAEYYHREHPAEIFSPLAEYRELMDRTFGKPAGLWQALRNNPSEAAQYFVSNSGRNLFRSVPSALLGHYRAQSETKTRGFLYWWVRGILLAGGIVAAARVYRAEWIWRGFFIKLLPRLVQPGSATRKLLLLAFPLTSSLVAIVLLIGTPRYFLAWAPVFYLGLACATDSLLKACGLVKFEVPLVALALLCFCAPNYLAPRPNDEMQVVRAAARLVRERPVVAAWWAGPDVMLGLAGRAEARSIADGIHRSDIEKGNVDVLLIDANFRGTKTWADEREFWEDFERQPKAYGFERLPGAPAGRFHVYYKPGR